MTDTDALTERIARALARQDGYDPDKHCDEWVMDEMRESAAAVLPEVEAEVRKAKAEVLTKRWVCQVARSGYHNGASCRPDDAHNDWGCDYYYEASIRATEYETGDQA